MREGQHYLVRFTEPQRDLVRETLLFVKDRTGGNIASMLRTGVDRARLDQVREKLSGCEVMLSAAEVHVLFSALVTAVVEIRTEQEFFTRVGFFKEQAVSLANALVRDIASAGDPG